ncbi:hypothetical protein [Clostridium botulinum]|uniref:hypothetical protein n=1 Tax=Clostridium botulinum TaxID=1491 RepID=UPI001C9A6E32|nr:hypothetical protein [Clostridium botulinum]MBY6838663.1 hypothetical protein [Clostridium botulinum]
MEYISAEEFFKQPVEVQEVFVDWWKPSTGDLIGIKTQCVDSSWNTVTKYKVSCVNEDDLFNYNSKEELLDSFKVIGGQSYSDKTVLLPTEGQLRRFIENKTESKILKIFLNEFEVGNETFKRYCIHLTNFRIFMNQSENLLQAYWKVACEIANEMC